MARVEFTAQAREDVRDLDGSARKLVLRAIKKLEDDPEKRERRSAVSRRVT